MKKKRWLAAAMAVLLAASGIAANVSVRAQEAPQENPVVFEEDFESADALDGWTVSNGTEYTLAELQSRNGNQLLKIEQTADSVSSKNLEVIHELDGQTGDLVLSCQVAAEEITSGALYLPTFYSGSARLMEIAFNYSGNISYKPNGGQLTYVESPKYEAMEWYQVQQVYHADSHTMDLYLNGDKIFEGQAVKTGENGESLEVNRIAMSTYRKNDGKWFIDDIMVTKGTELPKMQELPSLVLPQPDVIYAEDFTGDAALDSGWTVKNQGSAQVAVEHNGDNDVLTVTQEGNDTSMTLRRSLGQTYSGKLYLSYSVAAANNTSGAMYLPTFFGGTSEIIKLQMNGSSSAGGQFKYQPTGSGAVDLGVPFEPMKWYTIKIVYDNDAAVYDLFINGQQVLTQEPAYKAAAADMIGFGVYKLSLIHI